MAEFSKLVITDKGRGLIAKALGDKAIIKFTKVVSSGEIYTIEELETLESITDIHQSSLVSSVSVTNDTSVEIQVSFHNMELKEGYYLRAFGLYAEDPDEGEIIYGATVETSGNCYIPAYNGVTSSGISLNFVTTVGNAQNVSLEINQAAIATIKNIQDIEEMITDTGSIEKAFRQVFFGEETDQDIMSLNDIKDAISTKWDGETSEDVTAMNSEDVDSAISTPWNGESSEDPEAMSPDDVKEATDVH